MGPISVWTIWGEHVRRHLRILTGLALIAGGLPQTAAAASEPAAVSEGADALAKKLFREQRYPEAALEFERLWAEQQTPKYLFNAAMAREMMGHELQAFVHLQVFIGLPGQPETEITRAKDRIEGVRERTVKLRVRVASADLPAGTLELNARRAGAPAGPERPAEVHLNGATLAGLAVAGAPGDYDLPVELGRWELEFTSRGYGPGRTSIQATRGPASQIVVQLERLIDTIEVTAEFTPAAALAAGIDVSLKGPEPAKVIRKRVERSPVTWRLKPGAWTMEANAAGYEPVRRGFTAGAEPLRVRVQLAQAPRKGRRLALGLGVAGGVMAGAGAVVLGVAAKEWGGAKGVRESHLANTREYAKVGGDIEVKNKAWNESDAALVRNWYKSNAGAGVLGAGVGLGIGALTTLAPRQRSSSIAQVAVGALAGLGGGVAYSLVVAAEQEQKGKLEKATSMSWSTNSDEGTEVEEARASLNNHYVGGLISSTVLGLGVGLVVSGIAKLAFTEKRRLQVRRAAVHPYCEITGGGMMLRTQF